MEGSGEGVDVVVRNVKATGLVVTMVSRRVSRQDPPRLAVRRSASTLPLKYIQPRNAWMTATKKLSAPRISSAMQTSAEPKVKVNSGVQAYDDRYLSSYQIAHCKIEPTSPPGYSSEFPAQKVHPCRGGHFTVDTYSCEKTPPKSVRPDIVRNNSKGFDRGCFGQRSNSYQSDAFAHSLRQYSWSRACRTKSVDLMDRLVKYRHMKNVISSKISKSARTIPNKISNLRENRKARRNARVQTYTRARQDIERESSETPNISVMPQTLPGWRYRGSSGTSTYDYLKPAGELCRKLRDRTFDIRYLDNMAQYMRNPMNSIYLNESKVCPKILSRYNEHKRRNHSVEQANNTNQDWKTQANKNTGCHWPFERESTIQTSGINDKSCSTAPYESAMKYHLAGQGAKATRERTSSGISDESEHPDLKMQFWLDELPVLPNETPEQKLARVREMKHLANTLKGIPHDEYFDDNATNEIIKSLNTLPIWLPESQPERQQFKDLLAQNLLKKAKSTLNVIVHSLVDRFVNISKLGLGQSASFNEIQNKIKQWIREDLNKNSIFIQNGAIQDLCKSLYNLKEMASGYNTMSSKMGQEISAFLRELPTPMTKSTVETLTEKLLNSIIGYRPHEDRSNENQTRSEREKNIIQELIAREVNDFLNAASTRIQLGDLDVLKEEVAQMLLSQGDQIETARFEETSSVDEADRMIDKLLERVKGIYLGSKAMKNFIVNTILTNAPKLAPYKISNKHTNQVNNEKLMYYNINYGETYLNGLENPLVYNLDSEKLDGNSLLKEKIARKILLANRKPSKSGTSNEGNKTDGGSLNASKKGTGILLTGQNENTSEKARNLSLDDNKIPSERPLNQRKLNDGRLQQERLPGNISPTQNSGSRKGFHHSKASNTRRNSDMGSSAASRRENSEQVSGSKDSRDTDIMYENTKQPDINTKKLRNENKKTLHNGFKNKSDDLSSELTNILEELVNEEKGVDETKTEILNLLDKSVSLDKTTYTDFERGIGVENNLNRARAPKEDPKKRNATNVDLVGLGRRASKSAMTGVDSSDSVLNKSGNNAGTQARRRGKDSEILDKIKKTISNTKSLNERMVLILDVLQKYKSSFSSTNIAERRTCGSQIQTSPNEVQTVSKGSSRTLTTYSEKANFPLAHPDKNVTRDLSNKTEVEHSSSSVNCKDNVSRMFFKNYTSKDKMVGDLVKDVMEKQLFPMSDLSASLEFYEDIANEELVSSYTDNDESKTESFTDIPPLTESSRKKLKSNKDKRIHDKTESLYDRIKNWADKLPFDESVLNNEDINHLKQDITNNLFKKITDIDANPDIFNDSSLYEDVIKDQVDDALNDVQEYVQGDKHKLKKIKDELVNHIRENRLKTLNNMAGKAYKQQLRDAVAETIPSECGATLKEDEVSFDVLKESLADAFINLNYSNNDESLRNKAKKKITEEITKFCNDYLNRHPDLPLSETELNEELYSNLKNVPLPSNDSMKSEVEHVRIKEVINDWMKDLPLEDLSPSEQYQQMRKISILAKNLLDLEKIKNESNNSLVQADMEKEIVKWLTKMPLKTEEKDKSSLENFAQDLISMLKNTESDRKFHPSSRLSANATKSLLNEMHSPCLEPPCALSLEDCQLLERIRDRMCSWKSRTARRICKNAGVGSCMDYEGQTDAIEFGCKKSVPSVCPRGFQGSAHIRRTPSCWSPKPSRSCVKRIPSGELRSCCDRRAKRNYNCAARETCGDLQVKEECFWDPPEWSSTTRIPCSNIGQEPCPLYRNTRKSQQSSHKPCGYQRKHVRPAQTCPRENIDLQPQRYRQTRIRDAHLESYNVIRNPSLRLLPSTESSSVRFPIAKFWETPRENIYTSGEDSDAMLRGNTKRLERDCECYGKEPSKPRRKAQTNDRDCRHCSHEPVKNYSRNFAAQCPYPSYLYFRQ